MKPSTIWTHKRKGYTVVIADLPIEGVRMKDDSDANEKVGVAFLHDDDQETLHVRSEADFLAKFEPCPEGDLS